MTDDEYPPNFYENLSENDQNEFDNVLDELKCFPGFCEFIINLGSDHRLHSTVTMLEGLPAAVEAWKQALQAAINKE